MNILFIILVDFIVLILISFMIKKTSGSFSIFRIEPLMLIFFLNFFMYHWIGSGLIASGYGQNYYYYSFATNSNTQKIVWISILYASFMFFFTIYILEKVSKRKVIKKMYFLLKYENNVFNEDLVFLIVLFMAIASFGYYFLYAYQVGYLPIIKLLSSNSTEIAILRHNDKFTEINTVFGILKNQLLFVFPVITSYISFINYKTNRRFKWLILLMITLLCSLLCLTARFEKSFLIYYFIGFTLLIDLKKVNRVIYRKTKNTSIFYLFVIFVFGLGYVTYVSQGSIEQVFQLDSGPINRVIYSEMIGLFRHFEIFPNNIPFLGYKFYPNFIAIIFDNIEIRAARIVMLNSINSSTVGYMNTLFIGEAYANGGWTSVVFAPIIAGISTYFSFFLLVIQKYTVITKAAIVYWILEIPVNGGILDFLYNPSYFLLIMLVFTLNIVMINKKNSVRM